MTCWLSSGWLVMGVLGLVLWPAVSAAHGDWRVGQAQEQLKVVGFNPGSIDGVLGPQTREALRRYQASRGLPATGALDEATRQNLLPSERPSEGGEVKPEPWLKASPGGEFQKTGALYQLADFFPGSGRSTSTPPPCRWAHT